jgi:hypothetical protein
MENQPRFSPDIYSEFAVAAADCDYEGLTIEDHRRVLENLVKTAGGEQALKETIDAIRFRQPSVEIGNEILKDLFREVSSNIDPFDLHFYIDRTFKLHPEHREAATVYATSALCYGPESGRAISGYDVEPVEAPPADITIEDAMCLPAGISTPYWRAEALTHVCVAYREELAEEQKHELTEEIIECLQHAPSNVLERKEAVVERLSRGIGVEEGLRVLDAIDTIDAKEKAYTAVNMIRRQYNELSLERTLELLYEREGNKPSQQGTEVRLLASIAHEDQEMLRGTFAEIDGSDKDAKDLYYTVSTLYRVANKVKDNKVFYHKAIDYSLC